LEHFQNIILKASVVFLKLFLSSTVLLIVLQKSFLNTARQFSLQFVYQFDTIQV